MDWPPIQRRRRLTGLAIAGLSTDTEFVEQRSTPTVANRLWLADSASIRTGEGWAHLAAVLDCYSRRCVGWWVSDELNADLVIAAARMARAARWPRVGINAEPGSSSGHVALALSKRCQAAGIAGSLAASPLDLAVAEEFLTMLHRDVTAAREWSTREELESAIAEWIEDCHNPQTLGQQARSLGEELDELSL